MKHIILFLLAMAIAGPQSIAGHSLNPADLYFTGTYHQAVSRAQQEDKILVLEFSADWCMPCQWMKKNTFTDPDLLDYLNTYAIVLDLNIDEFHGFELKRQFDVRFLPTIIILNSNGDVLQKIEHSIGPVQLKSDIEALNKLQNKEFKPEISPKVTPVTESIQVDNNGSKQVAQNHADKNITPRHNRLSYQLQCGAFSDRFNADKMRVRLEKTMIDYPINVRLEQRKYKVFIEEIQDYKEAKNLQSQLKSMHQMPTFIRKNK